MNIDLLLALARFKQGMEYATKAEKALYLDDLISENESAIMALQNAIDKCEAVVAGAIDDVTAEYNGTNHKPIVEMKTKYIGVVK